MREAFVLKTSKVSGIKGWGEEGSTQDLDDACQHLIVWVFVAGGKENENPPNFLSLPPGCCTRELANEGAFYA